MITIKKKNPNEYMIFEGNIRHLIDYGFCYSKNSPLKDVEVNMPCEDKDIRQYLREAAEDKKRKRFAVVMRDPYRACKETEWGNEHVIVAPVFAALLLKEYDTAAKFLSGIKRPFIKGRCVFVEENGEMVSGEEIYMSQLFLADPDIPQDLADEIHERIEKYYGYEPENDLFDNEYLNSIDPRPVSNPFSVGNPFMDENDQRRKPYFAIRLEKLRRTYPKVFESMFTKLTGASTPIGLFYGYLNPAEFSMIMRMICRYHSDDHKGMIRWFEEETRAVYRESFAPFVFLQLTEGYTKDVNIVNRCLKDDKEYYPRFMKTVAMMYVKSQDEELHRTVRSALCKRGGTELTVDDLVINFWGDAENGNDSENSPLYSELSNQLSSEEYVDYLAKLLKMYRKYTKKKIILSSASQVMKNYYSTIRSKGNKFFWAQFNDDPFQSGYDTNLEPFRERLKALLSSIDSVSEDDGTFDKIIYYDIPFLAIADEELIVQNFEKGLLSPDRSAVYISELIGKEMTSLVPAVMAFAQ